MIQLQTSDQFGRHWIATKDIPQGTLLLSEEPAGFALDLNELDNYCAYCLQSSPTKRCTGCSFNVYCSRECQKLDWKQHKQECSILKSNRLNSACRLTIRLLLNRNSSDSLLNTQFDNLLDHCDKGHPKRHEFTQSLSRLITGLFPQLDFDACNKMLCLLSVNGMSVPAPVSGHLGTALCPQMAYCNHSCVPNSRITAVGNKLYLRSTSWINKGDQITISYIDTFQPTMERQFRLQAQYFFTCKCKKCLDPIDVHTQILCPTKDCPGLGTVDEEEIHCLVCGFTTPTTWNHMNTPAKYKEMKRKLGISHQLLHQTRQEYLEILRHQKTPEILLVLEDSMQASQHPAKDGLPDPLDTYEYIVGTIEDHTWT
ncbi:hypothetical protein EDD86DRAFT_244462 [Gorgonomyces haynaldii]|nr:hypothetical protein EDD86DRAFT_244462 [Gorgonomyces haynaldii]